MSEPAPTVVVPPGFGRRVFLNHPYSAAYLPVRLALLFAVLDAGCHPVALDLEPGDAWRVSRLLHVVRTCRYAVHDLTPAHDDSGAHLNMAFELGLDVAVRELNVEHPVLGAKRFILIAQRATDVSQSLSDALGYDPDVYGDDGRGEPDPYMAAGAVVDFLRDAGLTTRTADWTVDRYLRFQAELPWVLAAIGHDPGRVEAMRQAPEHRSRYVARLVEAMRAWVGERPE